MGGWELDQEEKEVTYVLLTEIDVSLETIH